VELLPIAFAILAGQATIATLKHNKLQIQTNASTVNGLATTEERALYHQTITIIQCVFALPYLLVSTADLV
jgi:hypothetical protein